MPETVWSTRPPRTLSKENIMKRLYFLYIVILGYLIGSTWGVMDWRSFVVGIIVTSMLISVLTLERDSMGIMYSSEREE